MAGANIDIYLDCSPYSYFGLLYLLKNREILKSYKVDLEPLTSEYSVIPAFLGGINVATGNKPPGSLPARARYLAYEMERAKKAFGAPNIQTPSFFPILSLLPQRAMVFVKDTYPEKKFLAAFQELWISMWEEGRDISKPEELIETLSRHFTPEEIKEIMEAANSPPVKQKLNDNTKAAIDRGAFGCPYMWVRNKHGKEEPFFGSDRFHYLWDFLEIPRSDVVVLAKAQL